MRPSPALRRTCHAAGFLLEKEIRFIGGAVDNPAHPFAAIIGGAKVSDKIEVISNLLPKVDLMIIGGGMANTFLLLRLRHRQIPRRSR